MTEYLSDVNLGSRVGTGLHWTSVCSDLERLWRFLDDPSRLLQGLRGVALPLGSDHLGPRLSGSLGLGCHGSLELEGQHHVLQLHHLNPHSPGVGGLVQRLLTVKV